MLLHWKKVSTRIHPKNVQENSPKRGILVDNSCKISTRIHPMKMSTRIPSFWKKVSIRIHFPLEFSIPSILCMLLCQNSPKKLTGAKSLLSWYINTVGCQNNCGDKDGDCTIEILSFSFEFSHGRVAAFSHYHSMTDVKSRRDVRAEKSPLRGFFASS